VWPPLLLLAVDPAGWYPFGPVKALVGAGVLLVAAALVVAPRPSARSALVVSVAFVAALGLAAAWGRDPLYAWTGTPERQAGVAMWAVCALALAIGASVEPRTVERGMVVAGLGLGTLGLAEALGWEPAVFAVGDRL